MSITVREFPTSRDLTVDPRGCAVSLEYWADSTDPQEDAGDINDAVANASPNVYKNMIKQRIKSKPLGGGLWHCTVEYGNIGSNGTGVTFPTPSAGNNFDMTTPLGFGLGFGTTGATQHITQSLNTLVKVGDQVDTKGAIGVSKNGVAGCDIVVPKFELTITRELQVLTMAYIHKIIDCTGCVNFDIWNTFSPFQVLFLGCDAPVAQGAIGATLKWTLTYHFLIGKHQSNIKIGSAITVPLKHAHDYLWVGYRDDVDATLGLVLQVPKFARVEEVYESRVFAERLEF